MKFSDLDLNKTYTYTDYLKWKFEERVELIKGKIFKMSPAPKRKHQKISIKLGKTLIPYFENNNCEIYYAPFDVRFPSSDGEAHTVVQPDICVVCDKSKLDELGCNGAPDFIIEILSASTSKKDYTDKYQLYEDQQVKEYWIVNPEGFIEVFVLKDSRYENRGKYFKGDVVRSAIFSSLEFNLDGVFTED
ncbi:MAG: Uma2 family endonuclease [Bacteroidota bacterium]